MEQPRFRARIARFSDRDKIVRLCKRAVGQHDYVLRMLDEVIRNKGLFIVFSESEELIGMSNFTPMFDKSGWLGMARTDPDWRGQGVAQFLQRTMAAYARSKGIHALRFFVLSTNTSSHRAARKGGFKEVAEGAHVSCNLKRVSKKTNQEASEIDMTPDAFSMQSALHSSYVKKMSGYVRYGYAFVRASQRNLAEIKRRNEIFHYRDSAFVLTRTEGDHGEFCILKGTLRKTLFMILRKAREMRLQQVGGFLPYDRHAMRVGKAAGFKPDSWGKHSILFEKRI